MLLLISTKRVIISLLLGLYFPYKVRVSSFVGTAVRETPITKGNEAIDDQSTRADEAVYRGYK